MCVFSGVELCLVCVHATPCSVSRVPVTSLVSADAFDVIPYEVCRRLMTPAESIAHYFIHQDIRTSRGTGSDWDPGRLGMSTKVCPVYLNGSTATSVTVIAG